jgi:hypothetical protein
MRVKSFGMYGVALLLSTIRWRMRRNGWTGR